MTTSKNAVFVEKATKRHSGKFKYDLVEYINATTKVNIVCPEGHTFSQTPNGHLSGNGCTVCAKLNSGKSNVGSLSNFLQTAKKIHGDKYDYSEVVYLRHNEKVKIRCNNGHIFMQTPNAHCSGKGCALCNQLPVLDNDSFILEANKVHGNRFDYSCVEYINRATHVTIKCENGHTFRQIPRLHLKGHGCAKCAGIGSISHLEFLERAVELHGSAYDYTNTLYKSALQKVSILCTRCNNYFSQQASSHLSGCGCPDCCTSGYRKSGSGSIYCLVAGNITKVGITNRCVTKRLHEISKDSKRDFKVLFSEEFADGRIPAIMESQLKNYLVSVYSPVTEKFDGYTECFIDVDRDSLINLIKDMSVNLTEEIN